jgi:hypothetical protein
METRFSVIKPVHLAIAVGAIIAAIVALPMISSAYDTAYPPVGSVRRSMIDKCAEKTTFSRWSKSDVEICLAYESLRRRYNGE